jgi:putative hydroxymethylpyrimidine transport system ATP-binding protein
LNLIRFVPAEGFVGVTERPSFTRPELAERTPAPGVSVARARFAYGARTIFEDLTLDLPAGQWTCLLGPSGVGKTTLLRLIAGLEPAGAGGAVTADDGAPLAGRIAWMAQTDLLLPWLSAADNVALGARLRGTPRDRARAGMLLDRVGLGDRTAALPAALSGGQRQRVALARTLMEDRPVIVMDEPFSALDAITRLRLQALAAELLAGRTVLLVTHDPMEALRLGHRVLVLAGTPATLAEAATPSGPIPREPGSPALLAEYERLIGWLDREAAP